MNLSLVTVDSVHKTGRFTIVEDAHPRTQHNVYENDRGIYAEPAARERYSMLSIRLYPEERYAELLGPYNEFLAKQRRAAVQDRLSKRLARTSEPFLLSAEKLDAIATIVGKDDE